MISNLAEKIKEIAEATGSDWNDAMKKWAEFQMERPFERGEMDVDKVIEEIKGGLSRGYKFEGEAERELRKYLERLR